MTEERGRELERYLAAFVLDDDHRITLAVGDEGEQAAYIAACELRELLAESRALEKVKASQRRYRDIVAAIRHWLKRGSVGEFDVERSSTVEICEAGLAIVDDRLWEKYAAQKETP